MPDLAHRSRTDVRKKPTSAPRFPHEPSTAQPSATRRTARPPPQSDRPPSLFRCTPSVDDQRPARTARQSGRRRPRSSAEPSGGEADAIERVRANGYFFGHETAFWHNSGETPFRMNPTTWGFPNCRILIIPKTAGNRLRTCQNAVSWPKSNDLAARAAASRGADGHARSSSIRRRPRPERTTRGLIRKHAPLLQADAPRASSGATTCRSARSPPANTKGSARSISTAETAPLRQNPLPRSAPIANPVRRQPARSNLRRVCDGSTGKACRNRIGFALESRWNRSGAA